MDLFLFQGLYIDLSFPKINNMSGKPFLLLLSLSIFACSRENKTVTDGAKARIDLMNQHDLDNLGKLYADSAQIESVGFDKIEIGPEGIKGVYTRYFESSPDLAYDITNMTMTLRCGPPSCLSAGRNTSCRCYRCSVEHGR